MLDKDNLASIASALRKLRGITVNDLASQVQLDRPNLSAWFGGRPRVLSEANALRICEHLGWRFDQLICSRVHMWRIADQEDLALLQSFLSLIASAPQHRLVIVATGIGNVRVGYLLFLATQDGEGTLIRVRRAGKQDTSTQLTPDALGFGETTLSHRLSETEYAEIWRDELTTISPTDYLERYEPREGQGLALNWNSREWTPEAFTERSRLDALYDVDAAAPSTEEAPDTPFQESELEVWLRSPEAILWRDFAWECTREGYSVQEAQAWKQAALKKRK